MSAVEGLPTYNRQPTHRKLLCQLSSRIHIHYISVYIYMRQSLGYLHLHTYYVRTSAACTANSDNRRRKVSEVGIALCMNGHDVPLRRR